MRRFFIFYVLPVLALLMFATAPLWMGEGTLYLRDVLTSHYPLKAAQAQLFERGEWLPLVDPYRAGGQPFLGNPNALPLYPTNLLLFVVHPLRALNAHFWIHLLLAPFAMFWLGRAWGLSRPAAWAAGTVYATSGFVLSLMNLYNLIAGAALAPAFVAAVLDAWRQPRPRSTALAGLLWALLVLAGDPLFALLAFVAAGSAGYAADRQMPRAPLRLGAALVCGTALTLPMVVEFLRILPLSLRGYRQYSPESALLQSFDPRSLVEWILPLAFGPPDLGYWGQRFSDGLPPLFYSLAPGLLVLALVPLARRSPLMYWGFGLVAGGIFLALGSWNPLVRALYEVPGAAALRYPIKVWLVVALGGAILAGAGFERLLHGGGQRRFGWVLAALTLAYLALWSVLSFGDAGFLRTLEPERLRGDLLDAVRLRWAGLAFLSLAFLAALAGAAVLLRRRPALGGMLLLAVHTASQLFFLRPLIAADAIEPYLEAPKILGAVPADARVVHGGFKNLFGEQRIDLRRIALPDLDTRWLARTHAAQLYPQAGIAQGRRYELNPSPEGLDAFLTFSLVQALERKSDAERLHILAASGVDVLLLDRALAPSTTRGLAELLSRGTTAIGDVFVYAVTDPAPDVLFATEILAAPDLGAALATLADPGFDPRKSVSLPGKTETTSRPGVSGQARIFEERADRIEIEVEAPESGVVVLQRTYLPIYRATIENAAGERASGDVRPANFHRLGVEVPAGTRRLILEADRRPTRLAFAAAGLGLLGLTFLARNTRRTEETQRIERLKERFRRGTDEPPTR